MGSSSIDFVCEYIRLVKSVTHSADPALLVRYCCALIEQCLEMKLTVSQQPKEENNMDVDPERPPSPSRTAAPRSGFKIIIYKNTKHHTHTHTEG